MDKLTHAYRESEGDTWNLCSESEAGNFSLHGFLVTTAREAIIENDKIIKRDLKKFIGRSIRNFPGRTPARMRPDGKPDPNFKLPESLSGEDHAESKRRPRTA